jgi:hypothetical protein
VARIDKIDFSFRAIAGTVLTGVQAVKVGTGGSIVLAGTAVGDAIGVTCVAGTITAGRPVSVLKDAEIVEFGGSAGSAYYSVGGGTVGLTPTTGVKVGHTVEGGRLVVRVL